ncbi:hypothetical protein LJR230_004683 [Trinickia sp. LjRoot230]|uniref:hypothetical protein n=1 Tax=Trinickia sp. LjRoot230 TaxID=3342288 RepID=UPI003ED02668
MTLPFDRAVRAAIAGGIDALLDQQDKDGLWREFALHPGAAEAWTTAWVGWCLLRSDGTTAEDSASVRPDLMPAALPRRRRVRWSCMRAATAVGRMCRPDDGWGYNRAGGADADSTAWALRFLAACHVSIDPLPWLNRFVDAGGGVHTFVDDGYGSWTDSHDDVAANVGLALLHCAASRPLAQRIGRRLRARWPVQTFWWSTPTYGIAWTLRLLSALGAGLPDAEYSNAQTWLRARPLATDAFECAHRLMMATLLRDERCAEILANQLLDLGLLRGWRGAAYLLVPPRDDGPLPPPNAELRGVLTTSLCVLALSEFMSLRVKSQPEGRLWGFHA